MAETNPVSDDLDAPDNQTQPEENSPTDVKEGDISEVQQPLIDDPKKKKEGFSNRFGHEADHQFEADSILQKYAGIIVVLFILLSMLVFALIEDYDFTTAVYFTTVTITTVGYGDVSPEDDGGKVFFIFFIIVGLSLVGFCMGIIASNVGSKINTDSVPGIEQKVFGFVDSVIGITGRLVLVNVLSLVVIITIGTIFLVLAEEFTILDAIYWSVATVTTVGYGDLSLSEAPGTRWFFTVYIWVGVFITASLLTGFASVWVAHEQFTMLENVVSNGVTHDMIKAMDVDGDGGIDRAEFLSFMLLKLHKVDAKTLDNLYELFDEYDEDGSGLLTAEDVITDESEKERRRARFRAKQEEAMSM